MVEKLAIAYVVTEFVFVGIDAAWLWLVGEALYRRTLGDILLPNFKLAPAAAFYLLHGVGIAMFAISPAIEAQLWITALNRGALFGLFTYATYALTNCATVRNWSTWMTLVDLAWGTALTGVSATCGYLATTFAASR